MESKSLTQITQRRIKATDCTKNYKYTALRAISYLDQTALPLNIFSFHIICGFSLCDLC
jgi:hypothetical protein